MSSQPRKDVPHKAGTLPAAGGGHTAHPREGEEHPDHGLLGDDVIHVPKGKNRLQYAALIGLLVFLTVIYLVPGALVSTFLGGNQDDPDYLAFEAPGGERTVLRAREYQRRRNGFADVLEIFEILKLFVGVQERSLSDDSAARLIVLDELTRDAGIVITDGELAQFLTEMRLDHPTWMMLTNRYGGPAYIEPNLKRLLAIRRYLDLVTQVARIPDVQAIEKRWAEEHVEVAYEYVELPVADLEGEAKAGAPDDAALEAWFAERPEFERNQFLDPVRYRATFAVYRDPASTPAAGLVARYPDTTGEEPELRAQAYYDQVYFTRFAREPEPDKEEPAEGEAEKPAQQEPPTPYLSFEEVKERALAEAPVYFAMQAWLEDMSTRAGAGETVDLEGEATDLGLAVAKVEEPAALEGLREAQGLSAFAVNPVATTPAGQLAPRVVPDAPGLFIVRVDEKLEPALPPFEKIRADVLASWSKERAAELALERLKGMRAGFETAPPADDKEPEVDPMTGEEVPAEPEERKQSTSEAFRAAAEAAGLTVSERPWLDKAGAPTDDPDAAKPAHMFLGQNRAYGDLDLGLVPPPELDRLRAHAYLVRVSGKRPIDIARMTPQVYTSYKANSASEPANQVRMYLTGPDLDDRYGITWLVEREPAAEDEGDEAGAEETDAGGETDAGETDTGETGADETGDGK